MKLLLIAAVVLFVFCAPVWSINKCTAPDGKVVFQDVPCAGKGEKIEVRPNAGLAFSRPSPAAEALPPGALPAPAEKPQAPAKAALEQEADLCLAWYKPKLRDPAGAYYTLGCGQE